MPIILINVVRLKWIGNWLQWHIFSKTFPFRYALQLIFSVRIFLMPSSRLMWQVYWSWLPFSTMPLMSMKGPDPKTYIRKEEAIFWNFPFLFTSIVWGESKSYFVLLSVLRTFLKRFSLNQRFNFFKGLKGFHMFRVPLITGCYLEIASCRWLQRFCLLFSK